VTVEIINISLAMCIMYFNINLSLLQCDEIKFPCLCRLLDSL